MKFNVLTKDLKAAMTTLRKGMYLKNTTLPILSCIRFNTDEDSVGLVGTDLENIIAEEIPADVESDGEACIAFKQLESCIKGKKVASHVTYFEEHDGMMTLNVGGIMTRLSIMSVTEFPIIPQIETNIEIELAPKLAKCLPFASTEDDRLAINGVHVHSKKHELVFVATDGRAIKKVTDFPLSGSVEFAFTIPSKACGAIIDRFKGLVNLGIELHDKEPTLLRVHDANRELIVKLSDFLFPDYEAVLKPAKNFTGTVEIELGREEFLETINTVCSSNHSVWIELVDGVMDIRHNNPTLQTTQQTCYTPVSVTPSDYVLMAYNPELLIRALRSFDTETVCMYVKPEKEDEESHNPLGLVLSPVYIGMGHGEDTVIMPMRPDPPKFGADWLALKEEEEAEAIRKAELDKAVAEMKEGSEDDGNSGE